MVKLAWLALAGAAGTLARYGLCVLVPRWCGTGFPWGTLAVNALGCFLFGLVWTRALSEQARLILLTGFLGAFTTFSTFAFDTGGQLGDRQWLFAAANVAAQVLLGLTCLFLGFALGRSV
jgi:CrcB protein